MNTNHMSYYVTIVYLIIINHANAHLSDHHVQHPSLRLNISIWMWMFTHHYAQINVILVKMMVVAMVIMEAAARPCV